MEQYIKKSDITAEINRIKKEECPTDSYEKRCKLLWFEQFFSFINTLEVKEVDLEKDEPVSNDLEEAADKHLVEKGYLLTANNGEHLAEVEAKCLFKAGAQWQKQQLIEKACEWLEKWDAYRVCLEGRKDWFIEQFKKAVEE